ncbi:MAG TPA: ABC transporter transmembrane domain-containing protein, partial [Allosphingosinicella sp.]|nr:ABC transporter transmembrane domain-containing protein [Allosphingosinicella sp.]
MDQSAQIDVSPATEEEWAGSASAQDVPVTDDVTACLAYLARTFDRPSSPIVIRAGLALDEKGRLPFHQIDSSLEQIGLRGDHHHGRITRLKRRNLPAILQLQDDKAAVLLEVRQGEALVWRPGTEQPAWEDAAALAGSYAGTAVSVEGDPTRERVGERPWQKATRTHWFWSEIWKVRRSFLYVAGAAAIINLLALAVPLFTMNVYDRIIPNRAAVSLWVLAFGVVLALLLDFSLRLARARLVDEVGRDVDSRLSQRLFEKVMNAPLASRSGSTGALARRISDYETVRDFFASTTVVLIVDILFLGIFLLVITLLAGWLVIVPIIGIAFMLIAGLVLQKAMTGSIVDAQADSSLQHSVLVEAIAGQETLKATGAEGRMLGRWRRYADMNSITQERLRALTAVSVNLAAICQQLMAVG